MDYQDVFERSGPEGLYGVYVGIVDDIEDPEDMGRVKLTFPWRDEEDVSRWARVAAPMAGDEIGTYFLPDLGDEVLVAFAGGDIHEPYILGGLWTGERPPQLPNDEENPKRQLRSRAEHTVTFDDGDRGDKPAGSIEIESSKRTLEGSPDGHMIVIDDEDDEIVIEDHNENRITLDESGVTIESPETIRLEAEQNVEIEADNNVEIDAKQIEASAKSSAEVQSGGSLDLKSTSMMKIKSDSMLKLDGSMIFLN